MKKVIEPILIEKLNPEDLKTTLQRIYEMGYADGYEDGKASNLQYYYTSPVSHDYTITANDTVTNAIGITADCLKPGITTAKC